MMKTRPKKAAELRRRPTADRRGVPAATRRAIERRLLRKTRAEEATLAAEMKQWIALSVVEKAAEDVADVFERAGRKLRSRFGSSASAALSQAIVKGIVFFATAVATDRSESRPAGSTRPSRGGRRR